MLLSPEQVLKLGAIGVAKGGKGGAPGVTILGRHHFMLSLKRKRKIQYVKYRWKCLAHWNGQKMSLSIFGTFTLRGALICQKYNSHISKIFSKIAGTKLSNLIAS